VLDIRNNSGGNNYLNRPIFYGLVKRADTIAKRGTFFAIIGRETFSAAQNLANQIDTHTEAILVGEPTGGSPNHFGDPLPMRLPNSKLQVGLSSVWWQDLDPRDFRPWIAPTIAAEPSSSDDRLGRDPALDAILAYSPEPSLTQLMRDALAKDRSELARAFATWKSDPHHKFLTGENDLNRLGANLFGENRADDAVAIFELNANVNPNSWLAQNSLGRAYAATKRPEEAKAAFERALKIRPNAPQTLSAMDPR
jgi:tetratricopeptide (TPR) repeat protein